MLKEITETIKKEFARRYEQLESNYLGLENRVYTNLETRIDSLEQKFDELAELIREGLQQRIERNEGKLEDLQAQADPSTLKEDLDEVKASVKTWVRKPKICASLPKKP